MSAIIGVAAHKLIVNPGTPGSLPGAIAVAVSLSVGLMGLLGVQHPAGGGTAYLAVASPEVAVLGWLFIPYVVAGATILCCIALLGRLVGRPYPQWWW